MFTGILCGLAAAFCNSLGFLVSAKCMKICSNPIRFLVYAHVWMMILTLPLVWFFLPEGGIAELRAFLKAMFCFMFVFFAGQGMFFMALRYFEASKLSSLLGLKIIVLTLIYAFLKNSIPNLYQILAIILSAFAAVMINWSGKGKILTWGWIFVFAVLVCYSFSDINETAMVLSVRAGNVGIVQSALCTLTCAYSALGFCCLPGIFFFRFDRQLFLWTVPYAFLWLVSQIFLFCCFALVLPVFGNVILACRGMFSVLLGMILSMFGIRDLDAQISKGQWILRAVASLLMIGAIALYSFAAMK
ncbi:MAG: EamA family transporter [Lentisphaeria bacterium]|nr:EamA family transporter [Lentisphaeria bacterium]